MSSLQECGLGRQPVEDTPGSPPEVGLESGGAGHRVLVFAQLKSLLELVETDVLQPGGISFLRLDGRSAHRLVHCKLCASQQAACVHMHPHRMHLPPASSTAYRHCPRVREFARAS